MSPIGWALRPLRKYATFAGRAPRAEFWWYFLFIMILYVLMMVVFVGSFASLGASAAEPSSGMLGALGVGVIFLGLFWLALLLPTIAVQVRRMHDLDRTGWWIGGFYLLYLAYMVTTVGVAASAGEGGEEANLGMVGLTMVMALLFIAYSITLLVFFCLPGTEGSNRYGPNPYDGDVADVFA